MYKGSKKSVGNIARELNVQYVLEGSVRKDKNNLRITARLIDAREDNHIWAERYRGTLEDVFDIQEKVSQSIAEALRLKLTQQENKKIAERPVENIAAYECYLKARQEIHGSWTKEGMERARLLLHNGLDIIGESEILYTGMALLYIYQYEGGIKATGETLQKAEEFLEKVYKINSDSHHYFYLLGRIERFRGNNINALRYFQKAHNIEPNNPETLLFLGFHLATYAGKPDLAEPYVKKVIEIDPLTPVNYLSPLMLYLMRSEMELAIAALRKALQLMPGFEFFLARYLSWNNQLDEAIELIDQFVKKDPINYNKELCLFFKYALLGKKDMALQIMREETKQYCWNDPDYPWFMADYYSLIDEKKEALTWLEHTINRGMINYPLLNEMDPFLENIRCEPRFRKLMEKIKYEWENFEV